MNSNEICLQLQKGDILSGIYNFPINDRYQKCLGTIIDDKQHFIKISDIESGLVDVFDIYTNEDILTSFITLKTLDNSDKNIIHISETNKITNLLQKCNLLLCDRQSLSYLLYNNLRFLNIKYKKSISFFIFNHSKEASVFLLPNHMNGMYIVNMENNEITNYYKVTN